MQQKQFVIQRGANPEKRGFAAAAPLSRQSKSRFIAQTRANGGLPKTDRAMRWLRSGSGLAPVWLRSGFGLDSVWIRSGFGLDSGWIRAGFGLGLGCIRTRFGPGLGQVWARFGPGLGRVWAGFGPGLIRAWVWDALVLNGIQPALPLLARSEIRSKFKAPKTPPSHGLTGFVAIETGAKNAVFGHGRRQKTVHAPSLNRL